MLSTCQLSSPEGPGEPLTIGRSLKVFSTSSATFFFVATCPFPEGEIKATMFVQTMGWSCCSRYKMHMSNRTTPDIVNIRVLYKQSLGLIRAVDHRRLQMHTSGYRLFHL